VQQQHHLDARDGHHVTGRSERAQDDADDRNVIDDGARQRHLERVAGGVARKFRRDRFA
jgi:hypothetical protein